jgi:hypothetical protein
MGATPITIDTLTAGMHSLLLQPRDLENWLAIPVSDTIKVVPGDSRTLRYNLQSRSIISSIPFGAEVVLGDSVVGTTPMVSHPAMTAQTLMLRKPGYEPMSVQIPPDRNAVISVPMTMIWQKEGARESYLSEPGGSGSRSARLYISGAATILSGVAAAYLKIKADERYQQYLLSNDPRFLTQTRRLDTAAGVAIAATQVGLGFFTYFIFTR